MRTGLSDAAEHELDVKMQYDGSAPGKPGADSFVIDALVQDLVPVRRLRLRDGIALALATTVLCTLAIAFGLGVRGDLANGVPHEMFLVRSAVLLGLGVTAAAAALSGATPSIGHARKAFWKWALAIASIFPLGAAFVWLTDIRSLEGARVVLDPPYGLQCLLMSALCAMVVGAALTAWMRRGAPVSPTRTGWMVGLASGALGTAAYSIACSENVVMYIGTWYSLAIAGCALAGRLIVPRALRW
ncbi:NrsF family protein [Blastomonas sp.]|uniref:NrsF family protein n=1 Tax=Blastomonas sp. TaxID=1909299 RepID=UPI003919B5CA